MLWHHLSTKFARTVAVIVVGFSLGVVSVLSAQPSTAGLRDDSQGDYTEMLQSLHLTLPTLPPQADDPNRPVDARRTSNGVIRRSVWGTWNNYDEAKATPYPVLPDPLVLKNGQKVLDADTWWKLRRPEILADFENEVYGEIPPGTPAVQWEVSVDPTAFHGTAIKKTLVGHIDNSAYPAAMPVIHVTMYLPVHAAGAALVSVPVIVLAGHDYGPDGHGGPETMPDNLRQILSMGWGYAAFYTMDLQPDSAAGLRVGIIGLMNHGALRKPDDWGVLRAWAWGLSRIADYLETDKSVDAKHLGLEGHSRWGKTVLLAAATDQRWGACYCSCSGEGGAKLYRRNFGETLNDVAGPREYYWMAGNFLKYAGHNNDLPVDSHEMMSLVAPRALLITGGTGDPWADPHGEFMATVATGPVYRLLGKKDLGTTIFPAPDAELISGDVAFRLHNGPHTDALDWGTFLKFAKRIFATDEMQTNTDEHR